MIYTVHTCEHFTEIQYSAAEDTSAALSAVFFHITTAGIHSYKAIIPLQALVHGAVHCPTVSITVSRV
jgi:hypothetical protein